MADDGPDGDPPPPTVTPAEPVFEVADGKDDGLLVAVTERRTRTEIDAFVDAMAKAVR